MKFTTSFLLLFPFTLLAQSQIERDVFPFKEVIVSEGIDLVLKQGDRPGLRISYAGIKPEAISIENQHKALSISLEGCPERCLEEAAKAYRNSQVTAYVTFTSLSKLVIYGSNEVIGQSPITSRKFVLESFGENRISLPEVKARKFKLNLYGENEVSIDYGEVSVYRLKEYGDNSINTWRIQSDKVKVVPWLIVEGVTRNPKELSSYH
ncbi:MAG: GIN domain-containing protein [Cyclobacteriaceae bacterium]